jgi:hypothetical protein
MDNRYIQRITLLDIRDALDQSTDNAKSLLPDLDGEAKRKCRELIELIHQAQLKAETLKWSCEVTYPPK